jgi:hypothetical protein
MNMVHVVAGGFPVPKFDEVQVFSYSPQSQ